MVKRIVCVVLAILSSACARSKSESPFVRFASSERVLQWERASERIDEPFDVSLYIVEDAASFECQLYFSSRTGAYALSNCALSAGRSSQRATQTGSYTRDASTLTLCEDALEANCQVYR